MDHVDIGLSWRHHRIDIGLLLNDKINNYRSINGHSSLHCGGDIAGAQHLESSDAISISEFHVIGAGDTHLGVVALVEKLLPLAYHPQIAVVEDSHLDRQAQVSNGCQFLDVHLDATIASNNPDRLIGPP